MPTVTDRHDIYYSKPLNQALAYHRLGLSVIPVGRDKRPLIPWEQYQSRQPTEAEIEAWWRRWVWAGVAIVTGRVSGVVVLDVDGTEGAESLRGRQIPATPSVQTGKGTHYYFAHPGFEVRNFAHRLPGLDFRGDGGYVLAPPSVHPSGRRYAWREGLSLEDIPLAACPGWLLDLIRSPTKTEARPVEHWRCLVRSGVEKGRRNSTIAALAGHLLRHYVDPYVTLDLLQAWNEARCRPPLSADEVATIVNSIAKLEARRRGINHE